MRNIPIAIAIVGLLAPSGGQALGIGDIKLHSSLNQPLDAEVPLVLSGEQLGQLRISLAGPGEFAKAGFERSPALTKLRFDPHSRRDGSLAIRIRSTEAISEPFLSFVMEVTWPEGRMLRGFTLLLDPPNLLAPPTRTASALTATSQADHLPRPTTNGTPASDDPPTTAETDRQRIAPMGPTEALYGPVGQNEKLWNIAERLNSDPSITTDQMALALFRLNPRAFSRANVNALNAGTYLRVPDRDSILQTSPSVAHSYFHGHRLARHGRSAQRTALPPVADVTKANTASPLGAHGAPTEPPKNSATSAIERLRGENERLRSRVIALEQRVTELTRVLDERVTLRASAQPVQPTPAPTASSSTTVLAPATVTAEPPPSAGGTPASRDTDAAAQRVDAESPVRAATTAGAPSAPAAPLPAKVATTTDMSPSDRPPSAQPVGASAPIRSPGVSAAEPAHTPASADDTPGEGLWLLGLSAALSASLLGVWWRRRVPRDRTSAPRHESDDRQASVSVPLKSAARSAPAGRINPAVTGTPPLSPPAAVENPEAPTSETELQVVDALFEADIYLSYGKHQQAAESIRQAIALTPDRPSHYLKLLEIYAVANDSDAFATLAKTLRSERRIDDPDFWSRLAVLERQMDCMTKPESPTHVTTLGHTRHTGSPADETDELIAKLKQFSVESQSRAVDSLRDTSERSVEPDEGQKPSVAIEHSVAPVAQPLTRAPEPPPVPDEQIASPSALAHDENIIAYEPLPTPARLRQSETGAGKLPTDAERSIENLLKELSAIHFEEHLNSNLYDPGASQPLAGGVARNPEAFAAATQNATTDDDDFSEPETSDQDSLEAKLDLARAYADMADYTQARSVLSEVLTDGTPQQRSEAQALLSRLR